MSKTSDFYWACRNGDLKTVQQLLPILPDEQKDTLESNGSTALHAAVFFEHYDIVKLLLGNGCATWIRNRYDNLPYDEAKDDKIRELFHRPSQNIHSNRYSSVECCFKIVNRMFPRDDDQKEDDDNIPKAWMNSYKCIGTHRVVDEIIQVIVHTRMMKCCLKKFQVSNTCEDVFRILKKTVLPNHIEYKRAKDLFRNFQTKQDVTELIRLYTLETPFYDALQQNPESFTIELYSHLSSLEERAFKNGKTYRSFIMTNDSIQGYEWAARDKDRLIEIQTPTSTSILEETVNHFTKNNPEIDGVNQSQVLCIFHFPEICYTAIDLNVHTPLSVYPHEKEVLLLPGTLFEVTDMLKERSTGRYLFHLKNRIVSQKMLTKALIDFQNA